MKTNVKARVLMSFVGLFIVFVFVSPMVLAGDRESEANSSELSPLGLTVTKYAPDAGGIEFKWPTHIYFAPQDVEIITDLRNNRFVYRTSENNEWKASPLDVKGPHSVVYNPADRLYYANDTENNRLIAFKNLAKNEIVAETSSILGVKFKRIHDVVIDPKTQWLYAIDPHSGNVFRFKGIGKEESRFDLSKQLNGYARSLTFTDGRLLVIGSKAGRVLEILDWDERVVKVYQSAGKKATRWGGGSYEKNGLILNDVERYDGHWYATCYFTSHYSREVDFDRNKFIRFETLRDLETGDWQDLSGLLASDLVPYYLTVEEGNLFLAIFNHSNPGKGDAILKIFRSGTEKDAE